VHERSEQDEREHTPSARVTLEVRILDAAVSSRRATPPHAPVVLPPGEGPLIVVMASDVDLARYLHTHLAGAKPWRVVLAENTLHAQSMLELPPQGGAAPVLVLDAPDAALLGRLPLPLREAVSVVLLADDYPADLPPRSANHTLLPWPLDVAALVQRVATLANQG
jgi:hypothetical protein